jgi:hypothetical protein
MTWRLCNLLIEKCEHLKNNINRMNQSRIYALFAAAVGCCCWYGEEVQ